MISCKSECLRILNIIVEYDDNISLQIMNKCFRKFELPERQMKIESRMFENTQETGFAIDFLTGYREEHQTISKDIVNGEIYAQILELSKYGEPTLTSQSLDLLQKIFQEEKNRIDKFYNQTYICEEN